MKKHFLMLPVMLVGLAAAGCASGPRYGYAPMPPPAPRVERYGVAPGPRYVWRPGYWGYRGRNYFWVPGAWVRPPRAYSRWEPGGWDQTPRGYRYRPGQWRR